MGHLATVKKDTWAKRSTEWTLYKNERRGGRPPTRWRHNIESKLGVLWMKEAQNGVSWENAGETLDAQQINNIKQYFMGREKSRLHDIVLSKNR